MAEEGGGGTGGSESEVPAGLSTAIFVGLVVVSVVALLLMMVSAKDTGIIGQFIISRR